MQKVGLLFTLIKASLIWKSGRTISASTQLLHWSEDEFFVGYAEELCARG